MFVTRAGKLIALACIFFDEVKSEKQMKRKQTHIFKGYCHGFSMLEVMVTLAVIAITATIAAPSIMDMAPSMALKSAARDLYAKLQEAKMRAIKENKSVSVRFNGAYYFIDLDGDGAWTAAPGGTDTFTDANGDGVYTTGEQYNDVDGNGVYSGEIAINFTDYGYGINRGTGKATANWSGNPCLQAGVITFNPQGSSNSGSIYLENRNGDVSYAVAVRTAGSMVTRRYTGATPFNMDYWN